MHITVIMPAFNAQQFLASSIQSVLDQTHRELDLIIIDDGSTDATPEIAADFAASDSRVRLVRQSNQGMGAALNHAMTLTDSTFVARTDADDLMLPHRLERQVQFLQQHPDLVVAASHVAHIDPAGRILAQSNSVLTSREAVAEAIASNQPIGFHHPTVIMRRDIVQQVGGYRPQFWPADDLDLWNRIAEVNPNILVQPEVLVHYRIHAHSVSISSARRARLMTGWVRQCMIARRAGQPEPSLAEFRALQRHTPFCRRLNQARKDTAKVFYKAAVHDYAAHRLPSTFMHLAAAASLQPIYVTRQVLSQCRPASTQP